MQRCSLFLVMAVYASVVHAQTITPRFAWPVNTIAEVSGDGFALTTRDGKADSISQFSKTQLEVRAHPEGLLILMGPSSGNMLPDVLGSVGISREAIERLITKYVVNSSGQFVRLDDSVGFARQMDSIMAPIFVRASALPTAIVANMRKSFSAGVSTSATARLSWTGMTGTIFDRSWTIGDSVAEILKQPVPGILGAEMTNTQVTHFRGVVTCPDGSAASVCWRFTKHSTMDMSALRASIAKLLAQTGVPDTGIIDRMPIPQTSSDGYAIYDAATGRPLESGSTIDSQTNGTIGDAAFAMSSHLVLVAHYKWHAM